MTFPQNKFLRASSIVLVGSLGANILNYIFNVVMGVLVPPAVYGDVVSLSTLLLIVSVPSATFTLVVAKYASTHWALGDRPAMKSLFRSATQFSFLIGIIGFLIVALFTPFLSSYLKIPEIPILIFGLLIPLAFIGGSSTGFLQGIHEFAPISIMSVLGAVSKLVFAIGLVYFGYSLGGIMAALVISGLLTYFYGLYHAIHRINAKHDEDKSDAHVAGPQKISWREIWREKQDYVALAFFATLFLTVFTNIDVILAKHYLDPIAAGQYAALSVLGKIITYGSTAILGVLFPLVSASRARGDAKEEKYLGLSLVIVGGAAIALFLFFAFFPEFVLHLLFGSRYLAAAPFLVYFAAAIAGSSIASVLVQFFLAVHYRPFIWPLILYTIAEIAGIALFHANIRQIVLSSFITSALLAISFIPVYFGYRASRKPIPAV